jgi:hypothetical protein
MEQITNHSGALNAYTGLRVLVDSPIPRSWSSKVLWATPRLSGTIKVLPQPQPGYDSSSHSTILRVQKPKKRKKKHPLFSFPCGFPRCPHFSTCFTLISWTTSSSFIRLSTSNYSMQKEFGSTFFAKGKVFCTIPVLDQGISRARPPPRRRELPPCFLSSAQLPCYPVPLSHTNTMPKQPSSKKSKKRTEVSDSESSDEDEPIHFFIPGERINPDVLSLFLFTYIDKTSRIRPCPHPTVRKPSRILFILIMSRTKTGQASMSLPDKSCRLSLPRGEYSAQYTNTMPTWISSLCTSCLMPSPVSSRYLVISIICSSILASTRSMSSPGSTVSASRRTISSTT